MRSSAPPEEELALFRERLASVLAAVGVSRAELGRRLGGKSSQYVSQLLSGAARPSRRRVEEIERALQLGVGSLTQEGPALPEGLETPERVLAPDFAAWEELLASARNLRRDGHLGTAVIVVNQLVERLSAIRTTSERVATLFARALILRSELHRCQCAPDMALEDAARARRLATPLKASDPGLFARAYFWHIIRAQDVRGASGLAEVVTDAFPDDLEPPMALLPITAEAFIAEGGSGVTRELSERLADALNGTPFGPAKSVAFLMLQMCHHRGDQFGARWVDEARQARETVGLAEALYHGAHRAFRSGRPLEAYRCLLESTQMAASAEFQLGMEHAADVWSQMLRAPALERAEAAGAARELLRDEIIRPVCQLLREVGLRSEWFGTARAFAWAACAHGSAALGDPAGALEAAGWLLPMARRALNADNAAANLAWAAWALQRAGFDEEATAMWSHVRSATGLALSEGSRVPHERLSEMAYAAMEAGHGLPELDAVMRHIATQQPTDAWAWGLNARYQLSRGQVLDALAAAERSWRLAQYLGLAQAFPPLPSYRAPLGRVQRQQAARREAMAWAAEAFTRALELDSLSPSTRESISRSLAALQSEFAAVPPPE